MQTVFETRRTRLGMLVKKHGTVANLNRLLGWPENNARLYQIHNRSIRSDRGTPYEMGDPTAREIEELLKLPTGWMDTPPSYAEIHGEDDLISQALHAMEQLPMYLQQTATSLISGLANSHKNHLAQINTDASASQTSRVLGVAKDEELHAKTAEQVATNSIPAPTEKTTNKPGYIKHIQYWDHEKKAFVSGDELSKSMFEHVMPTVLKNPEISKKRSNANALRQAELKKKRAESEKAQREARRVRNEVSIGMAMNALPSNHIGGNRVKK